MRETVSPFTPAGRTSIAYKKRLYQLRGGRCQYCGDAIGSASAAHLDHIHARSLGGGNDPRNIRLSCGTCNAIKRDRDIEHLRWCLQVRRSAVGGIISPKQAGLLVVAGIALPIELFVFAFEREVTVPA